ncbi:MAG: threonine/serine exporter family protein [Clostridia bacterium]|nr:threonine/serine exporter family protein [Clostridia bacterium]
MIEFLRPCLASFVACIGFSIVYQIRGKNLFFASFCGFISWAAFLLSDAVFGVEIASYFFGATAAALYAEISAHFLKSPVTVFLILGIIPLVPGLAVYRTMEGCLTGDTQQCLVMGIETLKIGGAIALGLFLSSTLYRLLRAAVLHIRYGKTENIG